MCTNLRYCYTGLGYDARAGSGSVTSTRHDVGVKTSFYIHSSNPVAVLSVPWCITVYCHCQFCFPTSHTPRTCLSSLPRTHVSPTRTHPPATQEIPFNRNHSRSIKSKRAHSYAGAATSTQLLRRCTLVFCCAFHGFHEFLLIRVRKHCLNSYIFFCIYHIFFKFSIIFSTFYFLHKNQNFTVVFFAKILFLCG